MKYASTATAFGAGIARWETEVAVPIGALTLQVRDTGATNVITRFGPVTVQSGTALTWESAIASSLRFEATLQPAIVLVGSLAGRSVPLDELASGFGEFMSQWILSPGYEQAMVSVRGFPALAGWDPTHVRVVYSSGDTGGGYDAGSERETTFAYYWGGLDAVVGEDAATAIADQLEELIHDARDEPLSFGDESMADEAFIALLEASGDSLLDAIVALLGRLQLPRAPARRVLWLIGQADKIGDVATRRGVLTAVLRHSEPWVRDGAGLALLELGSQEALGDLRAAREREPNVLVRRNLDQVILALEHAA